MSHSSGVALVNGHISALEEATIPVLDRGFLFGHAVFETLLVVNGLVVAWDLHFERLQHGCERALIPCPLETLLRTEVRSAIAACSQLLGASNGDLSASNGDLNPSRLQIRLILTGGLGAGLGIEQTQGPRSEITQRVIICRIAHAPPEALMRTGLALKTVPDARASHLLDVKSCNYLWNLIALEQAKAQGFDDAVFVTSSGVLSECSTANFLWLDAHSCLHAAPHAGLALPGTTEKLLAEALAAQGREIVREPLPVATLEKATAAFVLSSVRGFVPVRAIDTFAFDLSKKAHVLDELSRLLHTLQLKNLS